MPFCPSKMYLSVDMYVDSNRHMVVWLDSTFVYILLLIEVRMQTMNQTWYIACRHEKDTVGKAWEVTLYLYYTLSQQQMVTFV